MEEDALWPMQHNSNFSATDGPGVNNSDEEFCEIGYVFRGRRGNINANCGGSHRAIGRSACHTAQDTGGHGSPDNRGQSRQGFDDDPCALASWYLELFRRSNAPNAGVSRDAGSEEDPHGQHYDGDQQFLQR